MTSDVVLARGRSSVINAVLLDSGPLGQIAHPRPDRKILEWAAHWLSAGVELLIPEIADYEVRRELMRAGLAASISRLNERRDALRFVPINSKSIIRAAEFSAIAWSAAEPAVHDMSLDSDTNLEAQAATLTVGSAVVASSNPMRIARFAQAESWEQ